MKCFYQSLAKFLGGFFVAECRQSTGDPESSALSDCSNAKQSTVQQATAIFISCGYCREVSRESNHFSR